MVKTLNAVEVGQCYKLLEPVSMSLLDADNNLNGWKKIPVGSHALVLSLLKIPNGDYVKILINDSVCICPQRLLRNAYYFQEL